MAFRVKKLAGCDYSKDSNEYAVALLEVRKQNKEFFRFALHLKAVSGGTCHLIYLEDVEGEDEKVISRYFSIEGNGDGVVSVTKDFPRPQSDRWKATVPLFAKITDANIGDTAVIKTPMSRSRPRSGRPRVATEWKRERMTIIRKS